MLKGNWDNSKNNHGMSAYFKNNTCQRNGWIIYMNTKWLFFVTSHNGKMLKVKKPRKVKRFCQAMLLNMYMQYLFEKYVSVVLKSIPFLPVCFRLSAHAVQHQIQNKHSQKTKRWISSSLLTCFQGKKTRLFFQVYFIEKLQAYINRILGCS